MSACPPAGPVVLGRCCREAGDELGIPLQKKRGDTFLWVPPRYGEPTKNPALLWTGNSKPCLFWEGERGSFPKLILQTPLLR